MKVNVLHVHSQGKELMEFGMCFDQMFAFYMNLSLLNVNAICLNFFSLNSISVYKFVTDTIYVG